MLYKLTQQEIGQIQKIKNKMNLRRYNPDFEEAIIKAKAKKLYQNCVYERRGRPNLALIAKELGLTEFTLHKWKSQGVLGEVPDCYKKFGNFDWHQQLKYIVDARTFHLSEPGKPKNALRARANAISELSTMLQIAPNRIYVYLRNLGIPSIKTQYLIKQQYTEIIKEAVYQPNFDWKKQLKFLVSVHRTMHNVSMMLGLSTSMVSIYFSGLVPSIQTQQKIREKYLESQHLRPLVANPKWKQQLLYLVKQLGNKGRVSKLLGLSFIMVYQYLRAPAGRRNITPSLKIQQLIAVQYQKIKSS